MAYGISVYARRFHLDGDAYIEIPTYLLTRTGDDTGIPVTEALGDVSSGLPWHVFLPRASGTESWSP